jgi:iron complex outermembrane receptor protein
MSTKTKLASLLLASASAILMTAAAAAQEAAPAAPDPAAAAPADDGDETVVVTARRRSETLFETPATVTAVSGKTLRKLGITDISTAIQLIPNAVVPQDPQGFQTYVNIRGIRQADPQAEPNFGFYRNGIYAGGQRTNMGAQVDIARFEVLRGPQGGLYGRDAVGGAINMVFATPTDEFGGYASARYGRYNRTELEGAVNVPASENFALRLAGWYINQDKGEFYNAFRGEELDALTDKGLRLSARADFNEHLSVIWMAEYQETDTPSARTYAPNGIANGFLTSPDETFRTINRDAPLRAYTEQTYLSQDLAYETTAGTFHLLAAYRNYSLDSTEDQDYTALKATQGPIVLEQLMTRDESVENMYGEIVWNSPEDQRLTWVAGVSYFHEEFDFSRLIATSLSFNFLGGFGFPPLGVQSATGALPGPGTSITTDSVSAYVDFTYAVSDRFDLTASLRWNSDKKELNYSQYVIGTQPSLPFFQILFGSVVPPFDLQADPTFEHWSPSVGFHYAYSDNVNFYGLISDGFRAGGFNTTSTTPEFIPFGSEQATNYELGVKTLWNEGRIGANLAIFFMQQKDLVVRRDDPNENQGFGFSYLVNAGDADTWGVELELNARLADWLTGAASVGWLDAQYVSGEAFGQSLVGQNIPYTRDWTISLRLDADIPVGGDWAIVGTINYRAEFGGALDDFGLQPFEDLSKLDASAGVAIGDTRIVAYIDNAFDDHVTQFIFNVGAEAVSYGRTYGISVSTDF